MSDDTWTVAVEIPASLPDEFKDSLFTAVADAVHDWEPQDRDGWDVHVTGSPTPHGVGWAEAAVERARELARHPRTSMGRVNGYVLAADVATALDQPAKDPDPTTKEKR